MIISELKKIWRSRVLWVFLAALIVLNILQINTLSRKAKGNSKEFNSAREQIYSQVCGEFKIENLEFVIDTYEAAAQAVNSGSYSTEPNQEGTYTGYIFGDYSLFGEFYDEMNYMYNYAESMNSTIEKAKENIAFFTEKNNEYSARQNQQIVNLYENRCIDAYYKTQGAYSLICYDFSSVFVLLLCVLCISPIFTREHETQMYSLLKTTKMGNTKLGIAKISATLISAFTVALAFYLVDFFSFFVFFDIDCMSNPIYSISNFKNTPFSCSIGQYLLIVLMYRLIGIMVMSLIYLLCSLIAPDEILSFCISIGITVLLIFSGGSFNPVMMLTIRDLHRRYNVCNLFGVPVPQHVVLLVAMILLSLTLSAIILALSRRRKTRHRTLKELLADGKERLFS